MRLSDLCDDDFLQFINNKDNENIVKGFLGHKNNWTRGEFEDLSDVVNSFDNSIVKDKLDFWINRSSKALQFGEVIKLGNNLSKNTMIFIALYYF